MHDHMRLLKRVPTFAFAMSIYRPNVSERLSRCLPSYPNTWHPAQAIHFFCDDFLCRMAVLWKETPAMSMTRGRMFVWCAGIGWGDAAGAQHSEAEDQ